MSGYRSNLIGWHPNFAGNPPPGNSAHLKTVACGEHVSVSVIFLESPMLLNSSWCSFVKVDSMQMLFSRHVAGAQIPRRLGIHFEGMASEREVLTRILLKV